MMHKAFRAQSFSPEQLGTARNFAVEAAVQVADTLTAHFGAAEHEIKHDDERDWVTRWDRWAEDVIKAHLAKYSSAIGFLGEEGGHEGNADVYWTVDSIDGTSHFVRGNERCTTMIALVDHGAPVAACINNFVSGDHYSAVAGQGSYRNFDTRLSVSSREMSQAYLELYTDESEPRGDHLRKAIERTGAYLLRQAATGYTLASIARGGTEGFAALRNPYGNEWDIAPGALLIHEAGGVVCNVGAMGISEGFTSRNFDFVAANPLVFAPLAHLVEYNAAEAE